MAKKIAPLLPSAEELLHQFGDRLRLARQRRRLAAKQVAERAGMSPMTLRSLERGGSGVTMGAYLAVMQVLGIENDLGLLGKADPQGRELQDARLSAASKRVAVTQVHRMMEGLPQEQPRTDRDRPLKLPEKAQSWREQSGFADSETLAGLIQSLEPRPKNRR